ncbi:glycosyltransferase family 4 protein [Rubritalea spongiae]
MNTNTLNQSYQSVATSMDERDVHSNVGLHTIEEANQGGSEKTINVGVVTSTYARDTDDCQVPWMRELIAQMKEHSCNIRVMAPAFKGLKSHQIDGIDVHRFRYAPQSLETLTHDEGAPNKINSIFYKLLVLPYLLMGSLAVFWWCIKHKIDVLHIHWPFPHGFYGILPKYLLGVKVIAMSHGAELAIARRSTPVRKVLGWLLRSADVRCTNSSHTANEVSRVSGCTDSMIMPYGATVRNKEEELEPRDKPLLLFCGRLVQRKGIDVLLRSLPAVLASTDVDVVITGEGDRKAEWESLSHELGLSESVQFPGFVSDEELGRLYANCTLYVHPAIYDSNGDTEGLGVVLIEALAHKKPVIASNVGGIPDVIKNGETGILVEEKNEQELADSILRLLNDPQLCEELGDAGYLHVKRFFDWERIASETFELYSKLAARSNSTQEA